MSNQISVLRKLTIYNTSAQNNRVIESSAMTWQDLQMELDRLGISYQGMRAVIGETQTELITPQSELKDGDMTLFLMPRRVKSGINISEIVDPRDGVSFSDIEWTTSDPGEYTFKTAYDAGMAYLTRANFLSEKARIILLFVDVATPDEMTEEEGWNVDANENDGEYWDEQGNPAVDTQQQEPKPPTRYPTDNDWGFELSQPLDPEVEKLKLQAEELQRKMQ